MSKKHWIKSATANSHGQFREKAEHAGKSTAEFAKEKEHAPGKLGKQARLAKSLMGLKHADHEPKTKKKHTPHEIMKSMYGEKNV